MYVYNNKEVVIYNHAYTLYKNEDVDFTDDKYIIRFQNSEHSFKNLIFNNIDEFIELYASLVLKKYETEDSYHKYRFFFHEYITDGRIRLFFDIEIDSPEKYDNDEIRELADFYWKMEEEERIKYIISNLTNNLYRSLFGGIDNFVILSNNRKDKLSYHIIHKRIIFNNVNELSIFIDDIYSDKIYFIDKCVYHIRRTLRLFFSSKQNIVEEMRPCFSSNFEGYFFIMYPKYKNSDSYILINNVKKNERKENVECKFNNSEFSNPIEAYNFVMSSLKKYKPEFIKEKKLEPSSTSIIRIRSLNGKSKCIEDGNRTHGDNGFIEISFNFKQQKVFINEKCKCLGSGRNIIVLNLDGSKQSDFILDNTKKSFYEQCEDILSNDLYKEYPCEQLKRHFDKIHYFNDKYLNYTTDLEPFLNYKHISLLSSMGTGKTTLLINFILNYCNVNDYIIFFGCRILLVNQIFEKINTKFKDTPELQFDFYLDEQGKPKDVLKRRRAFQIESAYRYVDDIDKSTGRVFVIIDELPSLINQLTSVHTHREKLERNNIAFQKIISMADKIITATGTPDDITNRLMSIYRPSICILREKPREKRTVFLYKDETSLIDRLFNLIQDTKYMKDRKPKIAIIWQHAVKSKIGKLSKLDKFIEQIKFFDCERRILTITGMTDSKLSSEFVKNPDKYLEEHNINTFIYNSKIDVGVDILFPFDEVFNFGNYKTSQDVTVSIQSTGRTRNITGSIHFHMKYLDSIIKNNITSMEEINQNLKLISTFTNFNDMSINEIKLTNASFTIINTYENIKNERINVFKKKFVLYLLKYLYWNDSNIILYKNESDDIVDSDIVKDFKKMIREISQQKLIEIRNHYNDLPLLNHEEYTLLQKSEINGDEYSLIRKYNLYNYLNYTGLITLDIIKIIDSKYIQIIKNIQHFFQIIEVKKINPPNIDEIRETQYKLKQVQDELNSYTWINPTKLEKITNSLYFKYKIKTEIIGFEIKDNVEDIILNRIEHDIKKLTLTFDLNMNCDLFNLKKLSSLNKIKMYISVYTLIHLKLPLFYEFTMNREEYQNFRTSYKNNLKEFIIGFAGPADKHDKHEFYLNLLGYNTVLTLELINGNDTQKHIMFLKKLYNVIGFNISVDKHYHKYRLYMIKPIKNVLSIFRTDSKIPLINKNCENLRECFDLDDYTKTIISKFEKILLSD